MATFEPSPDLDPAVAQAIQEAMQALRAELAPQRTAPQPAAESEPDRLARLEEALGALDAATTQAGLLAELLRQAGRFAARSAFLVLDAGRYHGWAAYGFAADQETVTRATVDADEGAWSRVAGGAPTAGLDAADCARIVAPLGGEPATDGMLVAFSLRGHTAGALYADRAADDGTLNSSALRILTYVAAQALETLPLRRGRQAAAVAEAAVDETPVEPTEETPAAAEEVDVDEMIQEVDAAASVEHEILEIRRDTAAPPFEPGVEISAAVVEETETEEATGFETVLSEPEPELEPEPALESEPEPELDLDTAATDALLGADTGFETAVPEIGPEVDTEEHEAPTAAEPEEDSAEDIGFATQEISELESLPGAEEALDESAPRPKRPLEPTEVAPPADLDGPGWAFGGPATITDDTRHEEARRLARLLVTEIKLYNEEKVREGREQQNLTDQLGEDLERSRRIYEERIDEEVRAETDYFQEECVRILAGGDSTALGA